MSHNVSNAVAVIGIDIGVTVSRRSTVVISPMNHSARDSPVTGATNDPVGIR